MERVPENYESGELVNLWSEFIDWGKRRAGEGGFLIGVLRDHACRKIFDACLGEGADSVYLLKEGFDVTSNEIDSVFLKRAKENAEREGVELKITTHDWLGLDRAELGTFDAVMCMGNSLTYLFEKDAHLRALRNFRNLLKERGILLIDERNYQYMLDNRDEILQGNFRYSGKFVYCGEHVHGRPVEITDHEVKMEYEDTRNKGGMPCQLRLYPFKKGELKELLEEAGFDRVEQYSDYSERYNSEADFYQYVCVK